MPERVKYRRSVLDVIQLEQRYGLAKALGQTMQLTALEPIAAACRLIGFEPIDVEEVRIYRDPASAHVVFEVDVISGWQPTYEISYEEMLDMPLEDLKTIIQATV
jgi:uncharacterized protein YqiB (DUF1249 family)